MAFFEVFKVINLIQLSEHIISKRVMIVKPLFGAAIRRIMANVADFAFC